MNLDEFEFLMDKWYSVDLFAANIQEEERYERSSVSCN